MIELKQMRWSNAFSYGADNSITFNSSPLTQLVGKNGHGKSSIALILEEVLFNKNSKGIKKSDILNRYVQDKAYSIELDFAKDGVDYTIRSVRGTTQTVKLFRGKLDISAHTATATYKTIEELIGIDHKAFAQIVYQSNASSLEFLTATDANRKKFLMDFFDLDIYTRASDLFKEISVGLGKEIAAAEAKVNTITSWLNKYENFDLTEKPLLEEPELDDELVAEIATLDKQISDIDVNNKKINDNNLYKQLQNQIVLVPVPAKPNAAVLQEYRSEVAVINKDIATATAFVKKMKALHGTCPTCLSNIDDDKVKLLVDEQNRSVEQHNAKLAELSSLIKTLELEEKAYTSAATAQENWEKYYRLIDVTLPTQVYDKNELEQQLAAARKKQKEASAKLKEVAEYNKTAQNHNAKIETISKQLLEFNEELETNAGTLHELSERMGTLSILGKTFSTNGLVAYKIESLVKDLEQLTNQYLVDLSDGRFQLMFQVSNKDKLNVIITDNGKDIDIMALSGGERARVNAATLLAIRRLMQSISNSRINLLILDETVEALDVDGKEKLIETLIKEDSLNTFLVSHGFTHPLLEKVYVVKQNNVSYIEA
jgi:DNA repair exonuclease SbcCD ATPase subunit